MLLDGAPVQKPSPLAAELAPLKTPLITPPNTAALKPELKGFPPPPGSIAVPKPDINPPTEPPIAPEINPPANPPIPILAETAAVTVAPTPADTPPIIPAQVSLLNQFHLAGIRLPLH